MKKIIIFGVKNVELRRNIAFFLDEDYAIVGCSDGHYKYDILNELTYIPPEELPNHDFDYILITVFSSAAQAEIRRSLQGLGISAEKILRPTIFLRRGAEKAYPDLVEHIKNNYQGQCGLIFGLSYSANGICEEDLSRPFLTVPGPV